MNTPKFQTDKTVKRLARERAVYDDYCRFNAVPGQSKLEVIRFLMKTYKIGSTATVYAIVRRVEERLSKEA